MTRLRVTIAPPAPPRVELVQASGARAALAVALPVRVACEGRTVTLEQVGGRVRICTTGAADVTMTRGIASRAWPACVAVVERLALAQGGAR